jgi:hypothetical protein
LERLEGLHHQKRASAVRHKYAHDAASLKFLEK